MNELAKKIMELTSQDVSYRLGDLIQSYPPSALPIIVGVIRAVTGALVEQMTEAEKIVVHSIEDGSEIVILPSVFDPRKQEEQK